jgi:ketosteroid isomerase-like protein
MKYLFLSIMIVCVTTCAVAQTPKSTVSDSKQNEQQQVLDAEKARFAAMLNGEADVVSSLLADELTYTHTNGRTDTKWSFLTSLRPGTVKYETIESEDRKVHVDGKTAVVTGQAKLKIMFGGQELSFRVRYTEVCVRRDGRWQLVAWQSTRLPE